MAMGKMPKATSGTAAQYPNPGAKIPAAGKSKSMSSKPMKVLNEGGSGNWGSGHAGKQVPGQSASMGTDSAKFATGGKNSMFPKGSASPQEPGKSGGRG